MVSVNGQVHIGISTCTFCTVQDQIIQMIFLKINDTFFCSNNFKILTLFPLSGCFNIV